MAALQERMYAQDRWAVLLIFQALDAAGKDGTIKHVMSGLNPQSCEVHPFKSPSPEEIDHDFMWRTSKLLPRRGHIGIFNRSYYEEVLIVRVHPEILAAPADAAGARRASESGTSAIADITNFESYLSRQGVVIRKFFLHVSREEQKRRFLKRLEEPEKHWKFSLGDVHEREHFDEYHARLRGGHSSDGFNGCAVVCHSRRSKVVRAPDRGVRGHRDARGAAPGVPRSRRGQAARAARGAGGVAQELNAGGCQGVVRCHSAWHHTNATSPSTWHLSTVALEHGGTGALWHQGTLALWHPGTLAPLLVSQRQHRIDACRLACRQVGRGQDDGEEHGPGGEEQPRVEGIDRKQRPAQRLRNGSGQPKTNRKAGGADLHGLADEEPATSRGLAPSDSRTPISRVRSRVAYASSA